MLLLIVLSNLDDWFIFGNIFRKNIFVTNYISGSSFLWLIILSLFLIRTVCVKLSAKVRPIDLKFLASFCLLSILCYFLVWIVISFLISFTFSFYNFLDLQSVFKAAFMYSKNITNFLYLYVFLISYSLVSEKSQGLKHVFKNIFFVVKKNYFVILFCFGLFFSAEDLFKISFADSVNVLGLGLVNTSDYLKYMFSKLLLELVKSYVLCWCSVVIVQKSKRLSYV